MNAIWLIPFVVAAAVTLDEGEGACVASIRGAENSPPMTCGIRLANQAREAGRYAQSLALALEAAQGLERVVGVRNEDTLAARHAQAQALWHLGRYSEALALAERTWGLRRETLGATHVDTLASRNTMGASIRALGRTEEAVAIYRELLVAHERDRGAADPEALRVKNNLAHAMLKADNPDEALRLFESVLETRRISQGPRHRDTLFAESNLINALLERGDAAIALLRCEQTLPLHLEALGGSHPSTLILQLRCAAIRLRLGQDEAALKEFESLVPAFESVFGVRHLNTLQLKANSGVAQLRAGRGAAALPRLSQAYEGMAATLGREHSLSQGVRESMGFALLREQRFTEARDVFETDLGAAKLPLVQQGPVPIRILVRHAGAAQVRFELGERETAITMLEDVLERKRAQYGADHLETLSTLVTLASFHERIGNLDRATVLLEELVRRTERDLSGMSMSESSLATLARRIGEDFHRAGYASLVRLQAARHPGRALEVAELAKSRSLADSLGNDLRAAALDPAARSRLNALAKRHAAVQSAILQDDPQSDTYAKRVAERSALQAGMAELLPAQRGDSHGNELARLPQGAVYVSYLISGARIVAFVARSQQGVRVFDLGAWPGLAETVEAYRRIIESPGGERVWRTGEGRFLFSIARPQPTAMRVTHAGHIAAEISRRLILPLEAATQGADRWIVSPDGALAFLPFDLLSRKGRPLLESVSITYAPSLTSMQLLQARARTADEGHSDREFLGIAVTSPVSETSIGLKLPALPAAKTEVESIAALFEPGRASTFEGHQVTRTALVDLSDRGELAGYRYVHLATHAFLSEREARLSAIALSDNEWLNAVELGALKLGADLVVLSACETGLGRAAVAEGVVGLPHAIMMAGARSALLSLWRVSDKASEAFMVSFYRRLRAGQPPVKALRATKLEFARSKGPWSDPRHWAAYVLYGAT